MLVQLAGWYGAFIRNDAQEIERQRQWTAAICQHPALFGYQLYYVIVSDNSGVFNDISLRLSLPSIGDTRTRQASVLNEEWSRTISYSEETREWIIDTHTMCFGDINIWVIPKATPVE